MSSPDFSCDWCDSTAAPEEVTGGWACSACHQLPPECTCYELIGGHQPGCPYPHFLKFKAERACR